MAIFQTTSIGDGAYIYPDQTAMKCVELLDDASLHPGIPFACSFVPRTSNNYMKRHHKPKFRRYGSAANKPEIFFFKELEDWRAKYGLYFRKDG